MNVVVDVRDEFEGWSTAWADKGADMPDLDAFTARAIATALETSKVKLMDGVEVSVLYCGDGFMQELNKQWRGKDQPTNVLSFPAASGKALQRTPTLGDIIVSCDTVVREAKADNKTFADHLAHMLVHGSLHLVGFDHEVDDEAEDMEAHERQALAKLGIADPYGES